MLAAAKFLWAATRGHRVRPWRSPYLKWRLETYSGKKADAIRLSDFVHFAWTERRQLTSFLRWTGDIRKLQLGKMK